MFLSKSDFVPLSHKVCISSRASGLDGNAKSIVVDLYQVRLWKLLRAPEKSDLEALGNLFGCNPQEVLHTIVALYDKALSEVGGETIYSTICERKVVTVLVVIDDPESNTIQDKISPLVTDEEDCLDTLLEDVEYPDSVFKPVFSDLSSDDEENEDESSSSDDDENNNEDDYSIGIGKYLKKVKAGKLRLPKRLIASLSFQKITTFPIPAQEEHVIDLQLMACRKKYRGYGIGRYLIKLLMSHDYVGNYDAIVTASDQSAIDFYKKFGFTEDAIMLSKYKNIGDCWTNTTKMCYLPPYSAISEDPIRSLTMMEEQFQNWQKLMFSSYQNQACLFNRLKNEMIGLYARINAQEQTIETLKRERVQILKENTALKNRLLLKSDKSASHTDDDMEVLETEQIIRQMEQMSTVNEKLLLAQMSLLTNEDCSPQTAVEFSSHKLKHADSHQIKANRVKNDAASKALYKSSLAASSKANESLLFYPGHHEHLEIIASAGFTSDDFLYGSFGKGLYFRSNIPSYMKGKILLCRVALGRTELMSKSKAKSSVTLKRNPNYDSVKIFDMESIEEGDEIVLFDSHRVLPIFMITVE